MGKYIWPSNSAKAARWYLQLFKELSREMTLDNFINALAKDAPPRKTIYSRLQSLYSQNLLAKTGSGRQSVYRITAEGLELLEKLEMFHVEPPRKWDKLWRVVLFDIPESSRASRAQVRRLLFELGFVQLQLSAWVHPFPCFKEIEKIQSAYGIKDHIYMIEAVNFKPPESCRKHFRAKYPDYSF